MRNSAIPAVIAALVVGLGSVSCRRPSTELRRLTAEQIADRAKPATVIVVAEMEANVAVHEFSADKDKLAASLRAKIAGTRPSQAEINKMLFELFLDDPGRYLSDTGKVRTVSKKVTGTGTGLIVTPDGYLVTNAHVVEPDDDEVKHVLVSSIADLVGQDVTELRAEIGRLVPGSSPSEEAVARIQKVLASHYADMIKVTDQKRTIHALMGYTKHGDDVDVQGISCEIKKVGKPVPGKDVAILKMEGSDFPTVPLAENLVEGGVRTGAEVFILGYPGAVALNPQFSLPSRLEPSLTGGRVSGIKIMNEGWKVIQTDAVINPGNSGGPVFNDKGEVVGLATFMLRGEENGPVANGLNFVVAIDLVNEFLNDLHLKPEQGRFTAMYLQALDAYEGHKNPRALAIFKELNGMHPESVAIQDFVKQLGATPATKVTVTSRPKVTAPVQDRTESRRTGHPMAVLMIIGVVVAAILVVVVLANR
jgi:serine protease Do